MRRGTRRPIQRRTLNPTRLALPALLALLALGVVGACSSGVSVMPTPAPPNAPRPTPAGIGPVDEVPERPADALTDGTYVVRTGELALEVDELGPALDAGLRVVSAMGGYVGRSDEHNTAEGGWASVTYRVPVARWNEAVNAIRGLGRVQTQNTQALDVSDEIVDLGARVANLRSTEAALQAIMERASTIDDVLRVQRELTAVRSDIERLTADRDTLSQRAALAELTVRFEVPIVDRPATSPTPLPVPAWDASTEIVTAVDTLALIAQRLASLAIWLGIVVLPVVGPFVLIGYVVYRISRSRQERARMGSPDMRR